MCVYFLIKIIQLELLKQDIFIHIAEGGSPTELYNSILYAFDFVEYMISKFERILW